EKSLFQIHGISWHFEHCGHVAKPAPTPSAWMQSPTGGWHSVGQMSTLIVAGQFLHLLALTRLNVVGARKLKDCASYLATKSVSVLNPKSSRQVPKPPSEAGML